MPPLSPVGGSWTGHREEERERACKREPKRAGPSKKKGS